jgi:SAM-dependent methyltransferase
VIPPSAYALGDFHDPAAEVARLRQQGAILAEAEEAAFRELGFPDQGTGLDVGCGPGFVARRFLTSFPGLHLFGVDLDRGALALAREATRGAAASATALPFASGSFDFVYARLVLRYLGDPAAALGEMRRILKPRGRVFVLDSDDGALLVHPEPDGFADTLRARHESLRRRGGDPAFARKLPALLRDAGFDDVAGRTLTVSSLGVGAGAFATLILAPVAEAIDADLRGPELVEAARRSIRGWGALPGAFGMTTAVLVAGARPGTASR